MIAILEWSKIASATLTPAPLNLGTIAAAGTSASSAAAAAAAMAHAGTSGVWPASLSREGLNNDKPLATTQSAATPMTAIGENPIR